MSPQDLPQNTAKPWTKTAITLITAAIILAALNTLAATQTLTQHQPWYSSTLRQVPTLNEIARQGQTTDPYLQTDYPIPDPQADQNVNRTVIRARPWNAAGIDELLRRDALHTHGRDAVPHLNPAEEETHLWVTQHTVKLIRELQEIDIDDQDALNSWAEKVQQKPYDIYLLERRYQFGPSWIVITKTQQETRTLNSRNLAWWTMLAAMTILASAGLTLAATNKNKRGKATPTRAL